jgi:cytochrome c553
MALLISQYSHKKKSLKCFSLYIGLLLASIILSACSEAPAVVADTQAGMKKAVICGQCHGQNGISIIPIYPNLAGQKQAYMEIQLKAFRSGERINAAMTPHARRLSDQDIVDLSAYYANMDPSGKGKAE